MSFPADDIFVFLQPSCGSVNRLDKGARRQRIYAPAATIGMPRDVPDAATSGWETKGWHMAGLCGPPQGALVQSGAGLDAP